MISRTKESGLDRNTLGFAFCISRQRFHITLPPSHALAQKPPHLHTNLSPPLTNSSGNQPNQPGPNLFSLVTRFPTPFRLLPYNLTARGIPNSAPSAIVEAYKA